MNAVNKVELNLPLRPELIPLVMSSAEQTAFGYGLAAKEGMALALAVEEFYTFLTKQAEAEENLNLTYHYGGYYLEAIFRFASRELPVKAWNITAAVNVEEDGSWEEMGLLLAARAVDALQVTRETEQLAVRFIKEKAYPEKSRGELGNFSGAETFQVVSEGAELVKQFASRVSAKYGTQAPEWFGFPGKVADMLASGEYGVVMAVDAKGNVGAGMLWRKDLRLVEAYGPYQFTDQVELAREVLEACLNKLARTKSLGVIIPDPTPDLPSDYFESLGVTNSETRGATFQRKFLYRQLEEDCGSVSYVHPRLTPFLNAAYDRLVLPRQIQQVEYQGEKLSIHSAFAVEIDRVKLRVELRPLWVGADAAVNLAEQVRVLEREGYSDLYFRLDTGEPETAMLGVTLLDVGFKPQLLIPWGGRGDIILCRYEGGK